MAACTIALARFSASSGLAKVVGILHEDAGADEHGLGSQLHNQRGVGGGGDAAGREVGTGSFPSLATILTNSYGA